MGRIRTIKPEFFLHEGLYDLERETGFPIRVAYAGLWCQADREGRFRWRPRTLKVQVLPHDDLDFSRVLDALTTRGFIVKYTVDGDDFGYIPSFSDHQVINNRESASEIPPPDATPLSIPASTREARVDDARGTREAREGHAGKAEGKGREGYLVGRLVGGEEKKSSSKAELKFSCFPKIETQYLAKVSAICGIHRELHTEHPALFPANLETLHKLVGAAVRALDRGDDPLAMFCGIIRHQNWEVVDGDQRAKAKKKLQDYVTQVATTLRSGQPIDPAAIPLGIETATRTEAA